MDVMKIFYCLIAILLFNVSIYSQTEKLLTFNIRYDNPQDKKDNWQYRKEKVIQLLSHYEPAIFGIQEGLKNQVNDINDSLEEYQCIGVGRDDGKTKGEYCAIFFDSRKYKVIQSSTFWLSETPDKISVGWDADIQRICTYGLFEHVITKKKIWVFNTHFDHIGRIAQEQSAKLVSDTIQKINKEKWPVVLMGDFNVTPEQKPIALLKSDLAYALEISEKPLYGPTGTYNGFENKAVEERLDYIFVKGLKVLSYVHLDDKQNNNRPISDHLPVLINIQDTSK
jgi:endonuclease/exonuclease/phosphatase family metal-dependent hydrolase